MVVNKSCATKSANNVSPTLWSTEASYQDSEGLEPLDLELGSSFLSSLATRIANEDDWKAQFDATTDLRRLAKHHADFVDEIFVNKGMKSTATTVQSCIIKLIDSPRSCLQKNAFLAVNDLYQACLPSLSLTAVLTPMLNTSIKRLALMGPRNFILEDAEKAVRQICLTCNEAKAVFCIEKLCQKMKGNLKAKARCATCLTILIIRLGSQFSAELQKMTEPIVQLIVSMATDSNAEVRAQGKLALVALKKYCGFECFGSNVRSNVVSQAQKALDKCGNVKLDKVVGLSEIEPGPPPKVPCDSKTLPKPKDNLNCSSSRVYSPVSIKDSSKKRSLAVMHSKFCSTQLPNTIKKHTTTTATATTVAESAQFSKQMLLNNRRYSADMKSPISCSSVNAAAAAATTTTTTSSQQKKKSGSTVTDCSKRFDSTKPKQSCAQTTKKQKSTSSLRVVGRTDSFLSLSAAKSAKMLGMDSNTVDNSSSSYAKMDNNSSTGSSIMNNKHHSKQLTANVVKSKAPGMKYSMLRVVPKLLKLDSAIIQFVPQRLPCSPIESTISEVSEHEGEGGGTNTTTILSSDNNNNNNNNNNNINNNAVGSKDNEESKPVEGLVLHIVSRSDSEDGNNAELLQSYREHQMTQNAEKNETKASKSKKSSDSGKNRIGAKMSQIVKLDSAIMEFVPMQSKSVDLSDDSYDSLNDFE